MVPSPVVVGSCCRRARYLSCNEDVGTVLNKEKTREEVLQKQQHQQDSADEYVEFHQRAVSAGFYGVDEYQYRGKMSEWTPKSSEILRAHEMGFTSEQYLDYLTRVAHGELDAFKMASKDYSIQELGEQNAEDRKQLEQDLLAAGFDRDAFNDDFPRNVDVPLERNLVQAEDVEADFPDYVSWGVKPGHDVPADSDVNVAPEENLAQNLGEEEV